MASQDEIISVASVVNDVIQTHPATTTVFNQFGIDACCGGAASIQDAAVRDGADPVALLSALNGIMVGARHGTGSAA